MIPFIVICLLALVAWILVWSVISIVRIGGLRKQIRDMQARLTGQATLLDDLRVLVRRLWNEAGPPSPPAPAPTPVVAPGREQPELAAASSTPISAGPASTPAFSALPPAPPPVLPQAPSQRGINWEVFLGVKLFAWIGGLALFLGVAYFVKYSFDNNLVPPALRMALGYLTGFGLLAGGVAMSRRPYRVTAQTLCATGVVILYAVTFACHAVYHFEFFGLLPTFLIMVTVTVAAFAVAAAFEAQVVALLGMVGGFLTPVLLSTGVDNPVGLFGYVAVLDVGLLAVALRRRWSYLGALAALGTIVTEAGWVAEFFTTNKVQVAVNIFLGFCPLFLIGFLWASRRLHLQRSGRGWLAGAAVAIAFAAIAFSFLLLGYPTVAARPWFSLGLAFGADLCLLALVAVDAWVPPAGLGRIQLISGAAVFLLVASWLIGFATNALLPWVLAACLVFAGLHTLFPLLLQRFRPGAAPAWWAHLFSPAALLLVLLTIVRLPEVSWLVWPLVFAVDLLAIGAAFFSGALFAMVFALVVTIAVTAAWLLCVPLELADISTALIVIAGFGALFFSAGTRALRRVGHRTTNPDLPSWLANRAGAEYLPALSAGLPFLLLSLVVLRLPLTGPTPIFAVAALFVCLLAALSRMSINGALPAVALICTALLEYAWLGSRFTPGNAAVTVTWNLGFFLVFAVLPFACRKRFADRLAPWVTAALAAPIHFHLVYEAVRRAWPNGHMGLIPAAFILPAAASFIIVRRVFPLGAPRRLDVLAWFGGVALFFVTLVFPIQFERQWITLGWAFEGAALLWLFRRVPHPGLRLTGIGLLIAAFVRLALNPAVLTYHPHTPTTLLNWYLYAYGLTILSLIAGARLLAPPRDRMLGSSAPAVLYTLAGVLAFLLLNLEIADYFTGTGQTLTFQFSGNFARDMTYTIAWALFAFGLVVLGIARRVAGARRAAIGLLGVTLLKLFLHDLAHLDQLYRIGALVVVAVVAILASFLYQRFLPRQP